MSGPSGWGPPRFTRGVSALSGSAEGWGNMGLSLVETDECQGCGGNGTIFECPRWRNSNGHCCPAGTHQHQCPGVSVKCAECEGTGEVRQSGAEEYAMPCEV